MSKILYRIGEKVMLREDRSVVGVVTGYERGSDEPYIVETEGETFRAHVSDIRRYVPRQSSAQSVNKVVNKEPQMGSNIRQKIARLVKSEEACLFEEYEVTDEKGNLTDLGRRVVLDKVFQDKDLRAAVLADVKAVAAEEKKSKK